jgi:hypothetical protein
VTLRPEDFYFQLRHCKRILKWTIHVLMCYVASWGGKGYFRDTWLAIYFLRETWIDIYFRRETWNPNLAWCVISLLLCSWNVISYLLSLWMCICIVILNPINKAFLRAFPTVTCPKSEHFLLFSSPAPYCWELGNNLYVKICKTLPKWAQNRFRKNDWRHACFGVTDSFTNGFSKNKVYYVRK